MQAAGVTLLSVAGLETRDPSVGPLPPLDLEFELRDGALLSVHVLDTVVRLALREALWCELHETDRLRIRFGWDDYMYVGSVHSCEPAVEAASEIGLFVRASGRLSPLAVEAARPFPAPLRLHGSLVAHVAMLAPDPIAFTRTDLRAPCRQCGTGAP